MQNTNRNRDALSQQSVESAQRTVRLELRTDSEMLQGLDLDGGVGAVSTSEDLLDVLVVALIPRKRARFEKLREHCARRTKAGPAWLKKPSWANW